MMAWTVYDILPIDFGWEMLPTIQEVAARLAQEQTEIALAPNPFSADTGMDSFSSFMEKFEQAKQLAKSKGWEGDYRNPPRVFWLPDENDFSYGFVWKQDNNGTTFVVSPHSLKWLEALC